MTLAQRLSEAILSSIRRRKPPHRDIAALATPAIVKTLLLERRSKEIKTFNSRACRRLFDYRGPNGERLNYDEMDSIMAAVENFGWHARGA